MNTDTHIRSASWCVHVWCVRCVGCSVPTSVYATARLSGQVAAGTPVEVDIGGTTFLTPYVRLMAELNDDPFFRDWSLGVAGNSQQSLCRQVASQWQGFMVLTQFLSPTSRMLATDNLAPWNTNLILPLSVDALYANNVRLPIAVGTAYMIPRDAIITVRHQNASIVIRLLRGERNSASGILDATTVAAYTRTTPSLLPGVGLQPYSLMWIVDASSTAVGCGRLVLHHKHRGVSSLESYRSAWAWLGGRTSTDAQMVALRTALRTATVRESFANSNWNPASQSVADTYCPTCARSVSSWSLHVVVAGVDVGVERDDVYQPWRNHPVYQLPQSGPMFLPPFQVENIRRSAGGRQLLTWAAGEKPFRYQAHAESTIFAPQLQ